MAEYSADVQEILKGSRHIADAVGYGDRMLPDFERSTALYSGWWGDEGGDDAFANQVGPQVRAEQEQVTETVRAITQGFNALVEAVAAEATAVRSPQDFALDSIHDQAAGSDARR